MLLAAMSKGLCQLDTCSRWWLTFDIPRWLKSTTWCETWRWACTFISHLTKFMRHRSQNIRWKESRLDLNQAHAAAESSAAYHFLAILVVTRTSGNICSKRITRMLPNSSSMAHAGRESVILWTPKITFKPEMKALRSLTPWLHPFLAPCIAR